MSGEHIKPGRLSVDQLPRDFTHEPIRVGTERKTFVGERINWPAREYARAKDGALVGTEGHDTPTEAPVPRTGQRIDDPANGVRRRRALPRLFQTYDVGLELFQPRRNLDAPTLPLGLEQRANIELDDPEHALAHEKFSDSV